MEPFMTPVDIVFNDKFLSVEIEDLNIYQSFQVDFFIKDNFCDLINDLSLNGYYVNNYYDVKKHIDKISNNFNRDFYNASRKKFTKNSTKKNIAIPKRKKTYLMKDLSNGLYKIGFSSDPKVRESTLQSEKPSIKLVKVWDKFIEEHLHYKYREQRVRGEWFRLTPIQVKYICTHY